MQGRYDFLRIRMHRLVALSSLLLAVMVSAPAATAQVGVAAGLNFDRFSDIEADRTSFENATGFHVGIFYDLPLGPIAIRPGVFYMDVGTIDIERDGSVVESIDLNLFEVPVDLRIRMMTPLIKPYATVGPVLRFASSDDEEFEDSLNNFSVAANIGLGLELGAPGAQIRLFPELRYSFGISNLTDDVTFLGQQFSTEDNLRLNTFMVRLGVAF